MFTPNSVQVRVLKLLATKSGKGGMTRKDISAQAFGGNSVNFVPILDPLVKARLVDLRTIAGKDGERDATVFNVTPSGRKAAKAAPADTGRGAANHEALPKMGGSFTKSYKGKDIRVTVVDGGFRIGSKTYPSLTAAAQAVRDSDSAVNGWAFFGLVKGNGESAKPAPKATRKATRKPKARKATQATPATEAVASN